MRSCPLMFVPDKLAHERDDGECKSQKQGEGSAANKGCAEAESISLRLR